MMKILVLSLFIVGELLHYVRSTRNALRVPRNPDHHTVFSNPGKASFVYRLATPNTAGDDEEDTASGSTWGNKTASMRTSRTVASAIASSRMLDFPLPKISNDYLVIMVLSRREGHTIRAAIRETWAKDKDNVYFVIGQPCDIPKQYRGKDQGGNPSCQVSNKPLDQDFFQRTLDHRKAEQRITQGLFREQSIHQDLLMMHEIDMYRTLPAKLKFAYSFVDQHLPESVRWVLKVDDDFFVRVDNFRQLLREEFDETYRGASSVARSLLSSASGAIPSLAKPPPPPKPVLVGGNIRRNHKAARKGKWKELPQWKQKAVYPPFPLGSHGHAVTRPLVEYVARYQWALFEYQGEDTSIGIWFSHPSAPKVDFRETERMNNHGDCQRLNIFVVGHEVSPAKMKVCDKSPLQAS